MIKHIYNILFLYLLTNCSSGDEVKSGLAIMPSNEIIKTDKTTISADNPRKTFARLSTASSETQLLKASPQSDIAGVEVGFPPGCLASDSEVVDISLEQGVDTYFEVGTSDFSQIKNEDVSVYESSILLQSSDDSLKFLCNFSIDLPVVNSKSLYLSDTDYYVLFYHVFDKDLGFYVSGFKNIEILDGIAKIETNRIGAYQLVSLKKDLVEDIENTKSLQQSSKARDDNNVETKDKNDNLDDKEIVVEVEKKNIIVGKTSNTGSAPVGILFDDKESIASIDEFLPIGTVVSTLEAIDEDVNDKFIFSISGEDKDHFYIENSTHELKINKIIDYNQDAMMNISISVEDSIAGMSYIKDLNIPVKNLHPTKILFNSLDSEPSIAEHSTIGTSVASLSSVDSRGSSEFIYSLSGEAQGFFEIVNSELKVQEPFTYEQGATKSITITTVNSLGLSLSKSVDINIVNIAPNILLEGNSVDENEPISTKVGTLSSNDTVSFSLVSGDGDDDNSEFAIDGDSLRTNKIFDYEGGDVTKTIRIRATETLTPQNLTIDQVFQIDINNKNGSVFAWGEASYGGNTSSVASQISSQVADVYGTYSGVFVAIKLDGSAVTWGSSNNGGNSSAVASELSSGVSKIFNSDGGMAAIKNDGSVVTWGGSSGGDSSSVASLLNSGVVDITSNLYAFAARKSNGQVVTWGSGGGSDSSSVSSKLSSGVSKVYSTLYAFAALKDNGSVVTWGNGGDGGDSSSVADDLSSGVVKIFSTAHAFAALKSDGSVITWGSSFHGGDAPGDIARIYDVSDLLDSGVVDIAANSSGAAFAALKDDGSVVAWGDESKGGRCISVSGLDSGVDKIYSSFGAFAALKTDGSVVSWGDNDYGGDSNDVSSILSSEGGVKKIYSNGVSFAALKYDGSVVAWGDSDYGGSISNVVSYLSSGVVDIVPGDSTYAALKSDGSVVTWGWGPNGGDSSSVADKLISGVSNIYNAGRAFAVLKPE